jgi:hypothetical protein
MGVSDRQKAVFLDLFSPPFSVQRVHQSRKRPTAGEHWSARAWRRHGGTRKRAWAMTEIEPAEVERHGRVSPSDMEPVEVERASTSSHSTSSTANEPRSAWATFKSMPLGERCVYALAALPMLPVLLLVGPIIAAAKCAEGDNSRYYQGASRRVRPFPSIPVTPPSEV